MPAVVTVDALVGLVAHEVGFALSDTGLYFDGVGGTTVVINRGIYQGLISIGVLPLDPIIIEDADVAGLSGAAVLRVVPAAALYCLKMALLRWHFAVQTQCVDAVAKAEDVRGGWLWEEKQALIRRVADLEAELATPYADPLADTVAVFNRPPTGPCCPGFLGGFEC